MEQPQLQPHEPDGKAPGTDVEGMTEMNLREHLLAAQAAGPIQPQHDQYRSDDSSASQAHLPPDILPSPYGAVDINMSGHLVPLDIDSKGKRELSSSKRAAQNRAAQRAFRQRKEGYIKKLEDQVRSFGSQQESMRQLQNDNRELKEYVVTLQARLVESQGHFPPPPPSLDLQNRTQPISDDLTELQEELVGPTSVPQPGEAPTAPMGSSVASQLARVAVQAGEFVESRQSEESGPYFFSDSSVNISDEAAHSGSTDGAQEPMKGGSSPQTLEQAR